MGQVVDVRWKEHTKDKIVLRKVPFEVSHKMSNSIVSIGCITMMNGGDLQLSMRVWTEHFDRSDQMLTMGVTHVNVNNGQFRLGVHNVNFG